MSGTAFQVIFNDRVLMYESVSTVLEHCTTALMFSCGVNTLLKSRLLSIAKAIPWHPENGPSPWKHSGRELSSYPCRRLPCT